MTETELQEGVTMTLEELENVVALVCNKRVKFEVESQEWKGKDRWIVRMYELRGNPAANNTLYWRRNDGWHAYGPTYKQAMEHAEELALGWADAKSGYHESKNKGWYLR